MKKLIMAGVAGLASLALVGPAAPAFASASKSASKPPCASTKHVHCFGAMAFGKQGSKPAFGLSGGFASKSLAKATALGECARHGTNCKLTVSYLNSWGALAVGSAGGGVAVGLGASVPGTSQAVKIRAENVALRACSRLATSCHIIAVANSITGPGKP
jgi:hypothetical protein